MSTACASTSGWVPAALPGPGLQQDQGSGSRGSGADMRAALSGGRPLCVHAVPPPTSRNRAVQPGLVAALPVFAVALPGVADRRDTADTSLPLQGGGEKCPQVSPPGFSAFAGVPTDTSTCPRHPPASGQTKTAPQTPPGLEEGCGARTAPTVSRLPCYARPCLPWLDQP